MNNLIKYDPDIMKYLLIKVDNNSLSAYYRENKVNVKSPNKELFLPIEGPKKVLAKSIDDLFNYVEHYLFEINHRKHTKPNVFMELVKFNMQNKDIYLVQFYKAKLIYSK